jgi:predicted DNA repair protein MutK
MSSGLLALLDDIAAIAKAAAASIDDVAVQAIDASGRAAGVVIDDAAVTPKYVVGLSPKRELPIVWKIVKGSLRNKLIFLTPALLLLGYLAPWSVTPLLALGGLFLCFEGSEKILHAFQHLFQRHDSDHASKSEVIDPVILEKMRTEGAIRTDFILSAEIMAIAFNEVADQPFYNQVAVLVTVAVLITALVYGFVALVLKADDVGLHLAANKDRRIRAFVGRSLIRMMSPLLKILSVVGTLAMLWVGGQIIVHALPFLHHWAEQTTHDLHLTGFLAWLFEAGIGLLVGLVCGFLIIGAIHLVGPYLRQSRK